MLLILAHGTPDCTGRWEVRAGTGQLYWRCNRCNAVAYDTVQNHEAAFTENLMGSRLAELAEAGRKLLDRA